MHTSRSVRTQSGFTLIELLLVIVILGILAGIATFAIGSSREDAESTACRTDFRSISLSAEAVNTRTGTYPATTGGGDDTQANVNTKYGNLLKVANVGGVLDEYPFSQQYRLVYQQTGSGSGFQITVQSGAGTNVPTDPNSVSGCDYLP
jgi:prepilin-type N-terminal cleavage/methylation domain-containing protein